MRLPRMTLDGPYGVMLRLNSSWLITVLAIVLLLGLLVYPMQFPGLAHVWVWLIAATVTVLYFASLLLHEFGHAFAAHRLGIPIHGIELHLFGGVVHMRSIPRRPWEELLLALSGPLVSLALGCLFVGIAALLGLFEAPPMQIMATVASHLAFYNIASLLLNLVPIYPLDGGRVLRGLLWGATRNFRLSITLAMIIGVVLLGIMTLLGLLLPLPQFHFNVSILMLALFIGRTMWQGHSQARATEDPLDNKVPINTLSAPDEAELNASAALDDSSAEPDIN